MHLCTIQSNHVEHEWSIVFHLLEKNNGIETLNKESSQSDVERRVEVKIETALEPNKIY